METPKQIAVTVTTDGDRTSETHPSFGMVGFSRWTSSGGRTFFGSSIRHHAGVTMTLKTGVKTRSLSNNWFNGKEVIAEIEMTEAQFAQAICGMNIGDGVPCTLRHHRSGPVVNAPACPDTSERQSIDDEFAKNMKRLASQMNEVVAAAAALVAKPTASKADREALLIKAKMAKQEIESNLPFVQQQFNEAMDGVVTESKLEMESFLAQISKAYGISKAQIEGARGDALAMVIENAKE